MDRPLAPPRSILLAALLAAGCVRGGGLPVVAVPVGGVPVSTASSAPGARPAASPAVATPAAAAPFVVPADGALHEVPAGAWPITIGLAPGAPARLALVSTRTSPTAVTLSASAATTASATPMGLTVRAFELPVGPTARAFELPVAPVPAGLVARARYRLQQVDGVAVGDTRAFWVIRPTRRSGDVDVSVQARAVHVGAHGEVWVDARLGTRLDAKAKAIGQAFDARIHPTNAGLFGAPVPPPGAPPRVAILVSADVNNNGRDATIGYFASRDLLPPDVDPAFAHSNERMMLYMAASIVADGEEAAYMGTVAHEHQHLVNATRKLFGPTPARATEETWLDEMLSMYAMEANGFGRDSGDEVIRSHIEAYMTKPASFSLTDWERNPGQSGYGAAYLFVNFLAERYGDELVSELVGTPEVGVANLDARLSARGTSMAAAFRQWAAANAAAGTPTATTILVPGGGRATLLPWSASYLSLTGRAAQTAQVSLTGASTGITAFAIGPAAATR